MPLPAVSLDILVVSARCPISILSVLIGKSNVLTLGCIEILMRLPQSKTRRASNQGNSFVQRP